MDKIIKIILENMLTIIGILLGISISLLFIYIGFLKTILIVVLASLGGAIGYYIQKGSKSSHR